MENLAFYTKKLEELPRKKHLGSAKWGMGGRAWRQRERCVLGLCVTDAAPAAATQGTQVRHARGAPAGSCSVFRWTGLYSQSTRKPLKTPKEGKSDAWVWFSALTRTAAWGSGGLMRKWGAGDDVCTAVWTSSEEEGASQRHLGARISLESDRGARRGGRFWQEALRVGDSAGGGAACHPHSPPLLGLKETNLATAPHGGCLLGRA